MLSVQNLLLCSFWKGMGVISVLGLVGIKLRLWERGEKGM